MGNKHEPAKPGTQFGKLNVIGPPVLGELGNYLPCMCECGTPVFVLWRVLNSGGQTYCSKNCGKRKKHKAERLYGIWSNMKNRCYNSNSPSYKNYGGRGIDVCEAWKTYSGFRNWAVRNGYADSLTLERLDVDKGYSPDNCTWITKGKQASNKQTSIRVTFEGETKILSEWADDPRCSVKYHTLYARLRNGWNFEDAIKAPVGSRRPQASK